MFHKRINVKSRGAGRQAAKGAGFTARGTAGYKKTELLSALNCPGHHSFNQLVLSEYIEQYYWQ
jgi:hypothetical protein